MKQAEKLDRILRYLYDRRFDGARHMLQGIVDELKLPVAGHDEVMMLGRRLMDDRVVEGIPLARGRFSLQINTHGIDYCENHSYGNSEMALASYAPVVIHNSNNVVLTQHSPGAQVINASPGTSLFADILKAASADQSLSEDNLKDLRQILDEIKTLMEAGTPPRTSVDALIQRYGNLASIASLVTQLASMAFGGGVG